MQLREMQDAMAKMRLEGKETSPEYRKLAAEAANLSDTIGDLRTQTNILAHDDAGLRGRNGPAFPARAQAHCIFGTWERRFSGVHPQIGIRTNKHSMASPQSTITVAWNAAADFETNLERIITQKWIAIFPLGTEAWTEHRRTGYPRLLPAVVDNSGGAVNVALGARRMPYPVEEYTENPTNLQAAVSALNGESVNGAGDTQGTRVWWDRKNLN